MAAAPYAATLHILFSCKLYLPQRHSTLLSSRRTVTSLQKKLLLPDELLVCVQEPTVIATIEDFMWLKLHMVQPTASSSAATSGRLSPTSSSNLLSPSYTMAALQVTVSFADPHKHHIRV